MQQALHIFKKDVRQFRYQIALVLAVTMMFAFASRAPWARLVDSAPSFAFNAKPLISPNVDSFGGIGAESFEINDLSILSGLLVLTWCCLIALVVHAEAIPGDRQFWLTRPYDRRSLWGAKALFALAFVNLPMFIAQAAILAMDGLSIASNLWGLLWEQVLVAALIVIPAMAAATITRRMTQFVFLLFVAAFAASGLAILFVLPLLPFMSPWYLEGHRMGSLNWLQDYVGIAAIATTGVAVLFLQFMRGQTSRARVLAAAGTTIAVTAFWFVPWTPVFAVQSLLAGSLENSPHAEIARPQPSTLPGRGTSDTLDLPLRVAGLAAGTLVACEAATVSIEAPAGATWQSGIILLNSRISEAPDGCRVRALVDATFFNSNRSRQVRIRSALYLTVFGNERTTVMSLGAEPAIVPGAGVCRAMSSQIGAPAILCRAAFRGPRSLVWSRDDTGRGDLFTESLSYSPFPADLRISPVKNSWARAFPNQSGRVTIVSREPIAHVRTEVELDDIQLGDLEFRAR